MEIASFQKLMKELYFERDRKRGLNNTFLWFIEEIGELAEHLRHFQTKPDDYEEKKIKLRIEEELADVLAWLCSLANILQIDLQKAALEKYPGLCKKCGSKPCKCDSI